MLDWRSKHVKSREQGFESQFCANGFSFLDSGESFTHPFVFQVETVVQEFLFFSEWGTEVKEKLQLLTFTLFKGQL